MTEPQIEALRAAAQQALDLLERVPQSANDTVPIEKVREDLRRALAVPNGKRT
jgi:hypothetical protein